MTVCVKLFGSLRGHLPPGSEGRAFRLEVPDGGRVSDVVRLSGLPGEAAAVVLVNGEHVEGDAEVREGDAVSLFPPI